MMTVKINRPFEAAVDGEILFGAQLSLDTQVHDSTVGQLRARCKHDCWTVTVVG
jgi:hypothetical protein